MQAIPQILEWLSDEERLIHGTAIYTLFTDWQSTLIRISTEELNHDLHSFVTEIDPNGTTNLIAPDIVRAYLLGLLIPASPNPSTPIFAQISSQTNASAQALLSGLQHAPSVAQALFVNASATSYPIQTTGIEEYLADGSTTHLISGFLNKALALVMSDLDVFVNFTSSGLFSGAGNITVPDGDGLDGALKSLIGSAVHQDRNYGEWVNSLGIGIGVS